jgi:hypothetical protein
MTTKTTILLGAAAGAMMLLGAGGAWAQNYCSGDKDGWDIIDSSGGVETKTCYNFGNGNVISPCPTTGNPVVVTKVSAGTETRSNPGNNRLECVSEIPATCDVSNLDPTSERGLSGFADKCP